MNKTRKWRLGGFIVAELFAIAFATYLVKLNTGGPLGYGRLFVLYILLALIPIVCYLPGPTEYRR